MVYEPLSFKEIDFKNEVKKYGECLEVNEQETARKVFVDMIKRGREYKWIYFAISNLFGRSIAENARLFYYYPFICEVNQMCKRYDEQKAKYEEHINRLKEQLEHQIEERANRPVITIKRKQDHKSKPRYDLNDI